MSLFDKWADQEGDKVYYTRANQEGDKVYYTQANHVSERFTE